MNIAEYEQQVSNLTRKHRELDETRASLAHRSSALADEHNPDKAAVNTTNAQYAATITELERVARELDAAAKGLYVAQQAEREEAAKKAAAIRAKNMAKREALLEEAVEIAAQVDDLLAGAVTAAKKLDGLMTEAARLHGGNQFGWQHQSMKSMLRAMASSPWKLDRPGTGAMSFSDQVSAIAGRKEKAA